MKQPSNRKWFVLLLFTAFFLNVPNIIAQSETLGFVGTVSKSDTRKIGSQFVWANIGTKHPFVTFPSGFGYEITKVYEDEELIVLFFVSAVGSTETHYINKKIKQFTLIEVGPLESMKGYVPSVTHGTLN